VMRLAGLAGGRVAARGGAGSGAPAGSWLSQPGGARVRARHPPAPPCHPHHGWGLRALCGAGGRGARVGTTLTLQAARPARATRTPPTAAPAARPPAAPAQPSGRSPRRCPSLFAGPPPLWRRPRRVCGQLAARHPRQRALPRAVAVSSRWWRPWALRPRARSCDQSSFCNALNPAICAAHVSLRFHDPATHRQPFLRAQQAAQRRPAARRPAAALAALTAISELRSALRFSALAVPFHPTSTATCHPPAAGRLAAQVAASNTAAGRCFAARRAHSRENFDNISQLFCMHYI
jgi:hypothetical protein